MDSKACCGEGSCCCSSAEANRKLVIDFLYLDLSSCGRCQGTDRNLVEAVKDVSGVLKVAGYDVIVNKVNIDSKDLAIKYKFLSSPTIPVNDKDISLEVKESNCKDCGDLCGEDVNCRVWTYQGVDYNEPPKALIIDAILRDVYGNYRTENNTDSDYQIPHNLEVFFKPRVKHNRNC